MLRSEIPSGMCAKLHTVAASNNRVHTPRLLYYCLLAPHIYIIVVLRAHPVRGEPHIQRNVTGAVATLWWIFTRERKTFDILPAGVSSIGVAREGPWPNNGVVRLKSNILTPPNCSAGEATGFISGKTLCSCGPKFQFALQARNQRGTRDGTGLFWEGRNFFKLCSKVLNYIQHIFTGGWTFFQGAPPLVTGLLRFPFPHPGPRTEPSLESFQ